MSASIASIPDGRESQLSSEPFPLPGTNVVSKAFC